MRNRVVLPLLVFLAAGAVPGPGGAAAAQEALDAVDSLAAAGRTGEARERLVSWWEGAGGDASRTQIQRALWLRGRLASDGGDAERAYQRLVVEFPGGPYSARALFRLGQLAHARGDLPGAAQRFRTVVRDYAETPQRLEALRWLERHGSRARELAELERPGAPSPDTAGGGGDSRGGAAQPASGVRQPAPEARQPTPEAREPAREVREPAPEEREAPPAVETRGERAADMGDLAVQIGAFSRLEGARTLAARAREEGLEARLVRIPGSDLIRVRVGRLRDTGDVRALEARLARLGFETAVVSDVSREVPVR